MAALINSFYKWLNFLTSSSVLLDLIDGSLAMTPIPEQGASNKHLSNFLKMFGNFLPSKFATTQFETPSLCMFALRDLSLSFLRSLATKTPVFFMSYAIYDVLPPGAAAISKILSFGYGAKVMHGKNELGL
jgi:type III secretory pathway component EscT